MSRTCFKVVKRNVLFNLLFVFMSSVASANCDVNAPNDKTVDGSILWSEIEAANSHANTPCEVAQFSWNNFLYLASDDGNGNPKFMSLAPWYKVFPTSGKPSWSGSYEPLNGTQLNRSDNKAQAGDSFHLIDVAGRATAFDMRVNKPYLDYVSSSGVYTTAALNAAAADFNTDQNKGGVWLPPNGPNSDSSLEIKTAWRDFGSSGHCPSNIMHCETDSDGNEWGLVGFHLVQKTKVHGEFIWSTFEHVANAPDCSVGGGNPIKQNAVNQRSSLAPVNANINVASLTNQTGWNYFNYAGYKAAGGDGKSCSYPTSGSDDNALCMVDPNPSGDKTNWQQVNVCRTTALPIADSAACANVSDMGAQAACLNKNIIGSFPKNIENKWMYYHFIGSQYTFWGATGPGAPIVGCWEFDDSDKVQCPESVSAENKVSQVGSLHLANTTMETWMQQGIKLNYGNNNTVQQTDCFSCHQPMTTTWGEGDMSHMFGRISQAGSTSLAEPAKKNSD